MKAFSFLAPIFLCSVAARAQTLLPPSHSWKPANGSQLVDKIVEDNGMIAGMFKGSSLSAMDQASIVMNNVNGCLATGRRAKPVYLERCAGGNAAALVRRAAQALKTASMAAPAPTSASSAAELAFAVAQANLERAYAEIVKESGGAAPAPSDYQRAVSRLIDSVAPSALAVVPSRGWDPKAMRSYPTTAQIPVRAWLHYWADFSR